MTERPPVRLADYAAPTWEVLAIELDFALAGDTTELIATTHFRSLLATPQPLRLDADGLELLQLDLDDKALSAADEQHGPIQIGPDGLQIANPPAEFRLRAVTRLHPAANTALSGLYLSGGRLCTQCEAEGFRRLTYALDRPDVMTRYRVRLSADRQQFPTLLANGNLLETGELPAGRHYAIWEDPHKKPTYLFAVAAGAYEIVRGSFTTKSGRQVALAIHVDPGDGERAHYALDCLQRAMRWDEAVHGREYDLDVYNIVAVRDFNFGAMENKGLNMFNAAFVLADPATATDADYAGIESVIAHEYLHNWTGNRITLRDWFQLSLKEGLTVYRDQEFSADQRSPAVQRIKDVRALRQRQFPEDQGPLAHAVRPSSYRAIDNFYTATVYEKGAEIIRMLALVLGPTDFHAGLQRYYSERDGTAATVEDLLADLGEASGRDLSPFLAWYQQSGTPQLRVRCLLDAATGNCTMQLAQHTPPTADQASKQPLPIPLRIGFLSREGKALLTTLEGDEEPRDEHSLLLSAATATLHFHGVGSEAVPAVLRGFAAPVQLDDGLSTAALGVQLAHEPDPYTRWDAGQRLALRALAAAADPGGGGESCSELLAALAQGLSAALDHGDQDPAFTALLLRLPDLPEFVQTRQAADPARLAAVHEQVRQQLAQVLAPRLEAVLAANGPAPTDIGAAAAGQRALRAAALDLLAAMGSRSEALVWQQHASAVSMTEQIAALQALGSNQSPRFPQALQQFYERHQQQPLVIDKWFAVQAASPGVDALQRVQQLFRHPDFTPTNPNRVRALIGSFASRNLAAFHAADGSGYDFLVQVVGDLDHANPTLAARLLQAFATLPRLSEPLQQAAREALSRLQQRSQLSLHCQEMLQRMLA